VITGLDIAWAAGLFEGEGTVCKHGGPGRQYGVAARVSMTDRDVLESFQAVVGMGTVRSKTANAWPATRKPVFEWYVTKRAEVEALAVLLGPYLHERRRAQFVACLPPLPVQECEWCGKDFSSVRAAHTHPQARPRYCSVKCRQAINNHRRSLRLKAT
jgi:hypothetical protein